MSSGVNDNNITMAKESVIDVQSNGDASTAPQSRKESQASEKDIGHDIEEVYKIIGFGRVQWIVLLTGGLYLLMVINETLGMSIITLASQCDFKTDSVDKAILSSAGFMGIVVTSYFWGYLSDIVGRRKLLICTTLTGNLISFVSMFLPTYWPFVIFRFFVGVFISGASSTIYAYLGEFFTAFYRPIVINYASMFVGISMAYFPAISWLILSMDWSLYISSEFSFRPWRLIILFFFLPGLIGSIVLIFLPESPRFYLSVNRVDEAYKAVDWVCRHSKGESLADLKIFKIKSESHAHTENMLLDKSSNLFVRMWRETRPLFQRPHVLNLLISSIVMMGLFIGSSGMGLWYPTIQNRVGLSERSKDYSTVCQILQSSGSSEKQNSTSEHCDDTITDKSFIDSITIGVAYVVGYCILGVIINPVGRKGILIGSLALSGIFGIVLLWIKEPIAIVICFAIFLVLPGLCISVLSGAVVDLMPTYLRGKAVCIALMFGRSGSVIGSNIIGALLETQCIGTFGFFGGFGLLCAALMFLLPI